MYINYFAKKVHGEGHKVGAYQPQTPEVMLSGENDGLLVMTDWRDGMCAGTVLSLKCPSILCIC